MSATLRFGEIETETEVNLSNQNAFQLCLALAIPFESGETPDTPLPIFKQKLHAFLKAAIGNPDPAIPAETKGNWIECGRREGYLSEKAILCVAACREAEEKGATVCYFC